MPGKNYNPNAIPMGRGFRLLLVLSTLALCLNAKAQTCQTSSDLDDAARSALTTAGRRFFDFAAKADVASLRQNAAPALAADFSAIAALVKDHQLELAAAQVTPKSVFLLEAEGGSPLQHAEFYCGVFGKNGQTSGSAVFSLDNLAPGKYAVVILEAVAPQSRSNFSEVLQQVGTDWKLAGLQLKAVEAAGHDSDWFAARAREYKAKSQLHNAWLCYLQARSLVSPVSFMSTLATDKLYDEFQSLQPADLPAEGKPVDLMAGATTYKVTAIFPSAVGTDLDLIVRYQAADVSNTTQTNQNNLAVIKGLIAKYPEFKDAFAGVVARAVDPSGHDFGTLLAIKDIK